MFKLTGRIFLGISEVAKAQCKDFKCEGMPESFPKYD